MRILILLIMMVLSGCNADIVLTPSQAPQPVSTPNPVVAVESPQIIPEPTVPAAPILTPEPTEVACGPIAPDWAPGPRTSPNMGPEAKYLCIDNCKGSPSLLSFQIVGPGENNPWGLFVIYVWVDYDSINAGTDLSKIDGYKWVMVSHDTVKAALVNADPFQDNELKLQVIHWNGSGNPYPTFEANYGKDCNTLIVDGGTFTKVGEFKQPN